jgi:hypothetical protein
MKYVLKETKSSNPRGECVRLGGENRAKFRFHNGHPPVFEDSDKIKSKDFKIYLVIWFFALVKMLPLREWNVWKKTTTIDIPVFYSMALYSLANTKSYQRFEGTCFYQLQFDNENEFSNFL